MTRSELVVARGGASEVGFDCLTVRVQQFAAISNGEFHPTMY